MLLFQVFEIMVEPKLIQPTFVLDYPIEISPLAKPHRRYHTFQINFSKFHEQATDMSIYSTLCLFEFLLNSIID